MSEQLFQFKHDGDNIEVFTSDNSSHVFYSKNNGRSINTGMRYDSDRGSFISGSGRIMTWDDAKSSVRENL